MAKKCIPGVMCIENMTLFVMLFFLIIALYMYYVHIVKSESSNTKIVVITQPNPIMTGSIATRRTHGDTFQDPYAPPMKNDGFYFPSDSGDIRGIPVNIQTRGVQSDYQQVGILTRSQGDLILPLMGRRNMTGRDKWQYYTMSNTGNLSAKLPVSSNGKSCTGEYGCDSLSNGDTIFVDGYNDTFKATIYENNLFRYLPF